MAQCCQQSVSGWREKLYGPGQPRLHYPVAPMRRAHTRTLGFAGESLPQLLCIGCSALFKYLLNSSWKLQIYKIGITFQSDLCLSKFLHNFDLFLHILTVSPAVIGESNSDHQNKSIKYNKSWYQNNGTETCGTKSIFTQPTTSVQVIEDPHNQGRPNQHHPGTRGTLSRQ